MAQSDNGNRGVPLPPTGTGMEVGASLTDLVFGNQQGDKKSNGNKPLSLDNADSELLAAVLGGRMEEVAGRILSSGAKVDEGTQVLVVRAREKKSEQTFIDSLLHTAAAIATEVAKAKDMAQFKTERQMVATEEAQQEIREQKREDKQIDLFGGYMVGQAFYFDKFGGRYDDFGYTGKDGSYTTVAGDKYDGKGNIHLKTGDIISVPLEIASTPDVMPKVMAALALVEVSKNDMENVLNFLDLAKRIGGADSEEAVAKLSEDLKNNRKASKDEDVQALIKKIVEMDGGRDLVRAVFRDAGAFAFLQSALHKFFSPGGEEAVAATIATAPENIEIVTTEATAKVESSFTDMSKGAKAAKSIVQAVVAKAEGAGGDFNYGGGKSIAEQAKDEKFQAAAAAKEGGGLAERDVPAEVRKGVSKESADAFIPQLAEAHAQGKELNNEGTMLDSVQKAMEKLYDAQAHKRGYGLSDYHRNHDVVMGRHIGQILNAAKKTPSTTSAFNIATAKKSLASLSLNADDEGPETPTPQAERVAQTIAKKAVAVTLGKGR